MGAQNTREQLSENDRRQKSLRGKIPKQKLFELEGKEQILQQSPEMIVVDNLKKEYSIVGSEEKIVAIKNVSLLPNTEVYPIKKGEFVMLRGASGCGKTTFLNILGTIDAASTGTITIDGKEINSKSTDAYLSNLRLEKIGFVFQTFNLLASLTVQENVELPMRILGKLSEQKIKDRCQEILERVGLHERVKHLPSELSGGEQQRVAIARALSNSPKILLLDEPTGDLDTKNTIEVMDLLLYLNNFGFTEEGERVTMIMATHNPDVEVYADRVLYMRDGVITKQVINETQFPLEYDSYIAYLKTKH